MKITHLILLALALCLIASGQTGSSTGSEPSQTSTTSSEPSGSSTTTQEEPQSTSSTAPEEESGTASQPEQSSTQQQESEPATTTSSQESGSTAQSSTQEEEPAQTSQSSTASQEPAETSTTQSEPAASEPAQEEPAQEEPAQQQQQQPAQEEPAQQEPAQEEPAQEQQTQSEPAQEEPAQQQQAEPAEQETTSSQSQQASAEPAQEEPAEQEYQTSQQAEEEQTSTQAQQDTSSEASTSEEQQETTQADEAAGANGSSNATDSNKTSSSSSSPTNVKKFLDSFDESTQAMQCHIYTDSKFYDLFSLQNDEEDYRITSLTSGYIYRFNFCRYAQNPCGTVAKSYAFQQSLVDSSDCSALSDSEKNPSESRSYERLTFEGQTTYHLEYTLDGGDACSGGSTVQFDIQCNPQETDEPQFFIDDMDICNPLIFFEHESGCPVADLTTIWDFLLRNPWVLALFGIFVGPFVNFYGHRFLPWVIGVLSGTIASLAVFIFCGYFGLTTYFYYEDTADATSEEGIYALICVGLCFFAGLAVGYFMKEKFLTLGFVVLGSIAGVFVGAILFSLVIVHLYDEEWVLITSIVVLGLTGGIVAYFLKDGVMIIVTSFIGAYMFVRGISIFLGGYPGEVEMINMVKTNTWDVTTSLICYLVAVFALFVWGICYQNRHKNDSDEHYQKSE